MVAQPTNTPEEPPRSLSPGVKEQLEQALREFADAAKPIVTDALRSALERAGNDARARKLRAEELILLFKAMEQRIGVKFPDLEREGGATFRTRLIRALLEAYYDRVDAEAELRDQLRRGLERALVSLKESSQHIGEAERAIADYCRERHREGASAEKVIVEIKHIALPILRDDYGHLEKLVTKCIRHYYGDSAGEAATD
jgi:hypothetical protein